MLAEKFDAAETAITECPESVQPYLAWLDLAHAHPEQADPEKLDKYDPVPAEGIADLDRFRKR